MYIVPSVMIALKLKSARKLLSVIVICIVDVYNIGICTK